MGAESILVHVPATTSNLGPGFDVLGLALDLWNTFTFRFGDQSGWVVEVQGEGRGVLPASPENRVIWAFRWVLEHLQVTPPSGMRVVCVNRVPVGSGLGSSATATLAGMAAALCWAGQPMDRERLLSWASRWEGHPDNVAPALWGGLVATGWEASGQQAWVLPLEMHPRWLEARLVVVLPQVELPTEQARRVLPRQVPLEHAVQNLARTLQVVEALRRGDPALLARGMQDLWHQPYRLPLIPGAEAALDAARQAGAVAAMLSGAGPSVLAWVLGDPEPVVRAMLQAFAPHGGARWWALRISQQGMQVTSPV